MSTLNSNLYIHDSILKAADFDLSFLESSLSRLALPGVDYADLFCEATVSESWSLEDGIVKSGSFEINNGLSVRANRGEQTGFAYSDVLTRKALQEAITAVNSIGRQGQSRHVQVVGGQPVRALYAADNPFINYTSDAKVALLKAIDQYARAKHPSVVAVMATLSGEWSNVLVMGTDGSMGMDTRPLVRLSVVVIVEQNGQREQGFSGGGGRYDYAQLFEEATWKKWVDQAVHNARINLEAEPAPAGLMDVVLGPGWPGVLLHEAVGHGLEGDFNRKDTSAFSGKIGEQVASPECTVVDDGTLAHRRGSLTIDDEATPTEQTVLIENGKLVGYMHDKLSARLMNQKPTGNARRESYAYSPLPRMTNTYMLAGEHRPEDIIASVDKGLYATTFSGGQVDITSGKFVFVVSEAYLIENGKVTTPVKGATLIGDGPSALKRVSMVGNDLALDDGIGVCGKDGQSVPVGVGQPTLRINQVTVGGTGSSDD